MIWEFLSMLLLMTQSSVSIRLSENGLYSDIMVEVVSDIDVNDKCSEFKENMKVGKRIFKNETYFRHLMFAGYAELPIDWCREKPVLAAGPRPVHCPPPSQLRVRGH